MCLLAVAWRVHPGAPLVLAANRDEFHERPSAPAGFWSERPDLLGGRDLRAGGSWLLVSRSGRLAALTNVRDPKARRDGRPSRGGLVLDFAAGTDAPLAHLERVAAEADRYDPFNLLVGDGDTLAYFGSRAGPPRALPPGVYGLSNAALDVPWPKVSRVKTKLAALVAREAPPAPERLLEILDERVPAPDDALPDTGVGLEWERLLSPLLITSPRYGTRSSTALVVSGGETAFVERTLGPDGETTGERAFVFPSAG